MGSGDVKRVAGICHLIFSMDLGVTDIALETVDWFLYIQPELPR